MSQDYENQLSDDDKKPVNQKVFEIVDELELSQISEAVPVEPF